MSNGVRTEDRGRAKIIRFDRPEIRNPLSIGVLEFLSALIFGLDERVEKLIFTGSGKVFASGADLREIAAVDVARARDFALRGQGLMASIAELEIPAIAAVNGICYGGALDLALACRHRIASPEAEFCHPGAGLGIMTGWGGTQRLPRLIGEGAALEMFMTGKRVGADEALKIGLIEKIEDDPLAAAIDLCP
ncbi:MAG: enoyl-CoA hydratase/isomerase family protein [Pyrinomonadaceae bacterium]